MSNEQLWAPWRLEYIQQAQSPSEEPGELDYLPGADRSCFLCRAAAADERRRYGVVYRGAGTLTVLNRYPYNNGHLLVAPQQHLGRLDEVPAEVQLELVQLMTKMVGALERVIHPQGFNIGLNLGRVAGAGVPGHLHWHIVPRWNGDTNFMPLLAGVNVIPQSLDTLWELLTEALGRDSPTA